MEISHWKNVDMDNKYVSSCFVETTEIQPVLLHCDHHMVRQSYDTV